MAKKGGVRKIGRDAETGRIIPVDVARRRKSTATVETIKRSGGKKRKG